MKYGRRWRGWQRRPWRAGWRCGSFKNRGVLPQAPGALRSTIHRVSGSSGAIYMARSILCPSLIHSLALRSIRCSEAARVRTIPRSSMTFSCRTSNPIPPIWLDDCYVYIPVCKVLQQFACLPVFAPNVDLLHSQPWRVLLNPALRRYLLVGGHRGQNVSSSLPTNTIARVAAWWDSLRRFMSSVSMNRMGGSIIFGSLNALRYARRSSFSLRSFRLTSHTSPVSVSSSSPPHTEWLIGDVGQGRFWFQQRHLRRRVQRRRGVDMTPTLVPRSNRDVSVLHETQVSQLRPFRNGVAVNTTT